jgi:hypothetical protein
MFCGRDVNGRKSNRVILAHNEGKCTHRCNVGHGIGDLIKRLLQVVQNGEHTFLR